VTLKGQKVVTPIHLEANISKTFGDRGYVPKDRHVTCSVFLFGTDYIGLLSRHFQNR